MSDNPKIPKTNPANDPTRWAYEKAAIEDRAARQAQQDAYVGDDRDLNVEPGRVPGRKP